MKRAFLFSLMITCLFSAEVRSFSTEEMIQDLQTAKYKFSSRYALSDWKAEQFNWTLDGAYEQAKMRILTEKPTVNEYQKIFNAFLRSTNDYHVRGIYYSTGMAFFPLNVKQAGGRYFIAPLSYIAFDGDILFLPPFENFEQEEFQNLFHFEIGDEVLALDGTPIREVIERIIDEDLGGDRTPTGYGLAEKALFLKKGKFGMDVPTGDFTITVRHQKEGNIGTYDFKWIYIPELIKEPKPQRKPQPRSANTGMQAKKIEKNELNNSLVRLLTKEYAVGFAKDFLQDQKTFLKGKGAPAHLGINKDAYGEDDLEDDEDYDVREKGFLPELGQVIWETDPNSESELYAYLYLSEKGEKIGYLYLPTFDADEETAEEVAKIISRFQEESQALIVDITDNPGGNILYTYGVLAMLTDKPLKTLLERQLLIQEDVYSAIISNNMLSGEEELTGTLSGYPVNSDTLQQILNFNEEIIRSWNEGKRMTDPLYLLGIKEILPHPAVQYTKPLVVLINELDFSCADWFPAILQDNGRGVLFGSKTAGAGGGVSGYSHMSQFGVQAITLTVSMGFRLDGTPIENLGVSPDVPYQITENDLKENYVDYKQKLNQTVEALLHIGLYTQ